MERMDIKATRTKQYHTPETLGLLNRSLFMGRVLRILCKTSFQKLVQNKANVTSKVQERFMMMFIRNLMLTGVSNAQLGLIFKTTEQNYLTHCKKKRIQPHVVPLENGAKALWLGQDAPRNEKSKVVLYLHGGGYGMAGGHPDHWKFLDSLKVEAGKNGVELSTVILAYDLSYHYPFPRQLLQAATTLNYLLSQRWRPSQIVLAGESAGGNLIFALLLHILRPCPHVSVQINLPHNEPLSMAIAISPWTNLNPRNNSKLGMQEKNLGPGPVNVDFLSELMLDEFAGSFLDTLEPDMDLRWAHFVDTPQEWWHNLGSVCSEVLITGNTEEILISDIIEFGRVIMESQKMQDETVNDEAGDRPAMVEVMLERGVHAEPAIAMGAKKKDVVLWMKLLDWFAARI